MVEKFMIIDLNGVSSTVDKISTVRLKSNNKIYAFYTLNEVADNGLPIMYIAEANEMANVSMPIDDDAYKLIIADMLSITTGKEPVQFEYVDLNGKTLYVGLQKKMIIKEDKMKAIKDHYSTHIVNNVTPVTETVLEQPIEQPVVSETVSQAIEQPLNTTENIAPIENITVEPVNVTTPIVESVPESAPLDVNQPLNQQNNLADSIENVEIASPIIDTTPSEQPLNTELNNPLASETNLDTKTEIQSFEEPAVIIEPQAQMPTVETLNNEIPSFELGKTEEEKKVTYEEATQALETLNKYFQQTKTLPSDLINQNGEIIPNESTQFDTLEAPIMEESSVSIGTQDLSVLDESDTTSIVEENSLDNNISPLTDSQVVMPTSTTAPLQDAGDLLTPNNVTLIKSA